MPEHHPKPTTRPPLRYIPPGKGYRDGVLEDPTNDAVVAAFTFDADAEKWGPRIQAALLAVEVARRLLAVADRRMAKLCGKQTFRILTGLDLSELREAVAAVPLTEEEDIAEGRAADRIMSPTADTVLAEFEPEGKR